MSHHNNRKHNAKKEAVLKRHKKTKLLAGFAIIVIIMGVAYLGTESSPSPSSSNAITTSADRTQVSYPVSMFNDGSARHFHYKHKNMSIKYFILKSSDGVIRAAFDACDVCWPAGKGYYQDGDKMVCRNCGRSFASILVNEVKGGCNPAPLKRKVVGDQLVINVDDIIEGKKYFDFKKESI